MKKCIRCAVVLVLLGLSAPLFAQAPATRPASPPPGFADAVADLQAKRRELSEQYEVNTADLGAATPNSVLGDPMKRDAARAQVLELLAERSRLLVERSKYSPRPIDPRELNRIEVLSYLFGDAATVKRVDAMTEGDDAIKAQGIKLNADWLAAGGDAGRQMAVAAAADAYAAKHPENTGLTERIVSFVSTSASTDVRAALLKTTTQTMDNRVSKAIVAELEQTKAHLSMQAAAERQQKLVGKPMVVSGPTADGGTFSTESLKGKVVMVDFWATWCGPCKAELPHVKSLLKEYGDKGFAIVGVSGDESAEPLLAFVKQQNLPWPQLFDAAAAAENGMNPVFKQFDIAALPTVFVIDKKGICRTVTGRNELDTLIPKLLAE